VPDVQQEIRDWLHQRQDWLQQAAEILLSEGSVSDPQLDALVAHLKTPAGRAVTTHRKFVGLASHAPTTGELRLTKISDICGIENLVPRSPLSFGQGNLSVIYGHNGSGKSGYTRLLKKACGKPRATELKPNVFDTPPAASQCKIAYSVNGVAGEVEWPANSAPIDDIRSVDIFDADTAIAYLTEETAATYTPPSVALFEYLAKACNRIKVKLQNEQDGLVSALPQLPTEYAATPIGSIYRALKPDLAANVIQSIVQWEKKDQQALDQLSERLKAADPAQLARSKRNTKRQIEQLGSQLKDAATAFGKERLGAIRALRAAASTKRRVAAESAKVQSAELDGVGADTWLALWEAARAYSQTAYPGRQYPVTDDARCVLCHQELGVEAKQRLQGFEGFVQGRLETEAKTAEQAYQQSLDVVPTGLTADQVETRCQAAGLSDSPWVTRLTEWWREACEVRDGLLGHEANGHLNPLDWPADILDELAKRAENLEREASQHGEDARIFDRVQAGKDKLNLEARRWTSQQAAAIRTEIKRLRQVASYDEWKRLANPQGISRKAGEIGEQVITQLFVDRFNRELKALGASRIKVELSKTRTESGRTLHKLRLKGAQTGQDIPESVLSEGERRVVGLAAFLADVAEQPDVAPFVFDDPISSLDHDYEWYVAVRLVKLAQTRQVLVFTHRLSLYGAMEDAAKKVGDDWKRQNLQQHCIESFAGTAGHPTDQAVWNANTTKANNILLSRLDDAKKAGETSGGDAYRNLAQGICSDFRKLLERTVEDDLLNQVIRRHRRSVTTDNRLAPLPLITPEDCQFIDDLMTKYSCYEHSQSSEVPSFIPEEVELRGDIESLKTWRECFKKRQKEGVANA
jgi:energy-coupling factor transporter ATP-binding protein EcfA2